MQVARYPVILLLSALVLSCVTGCGTSITTTAPVKSSPPPPSVASSLDLLVYGATPAGIAAAVEAGKLGKKVVILEPTNHIGGMMSNGLGASDTYGLNALGGIPSSFFQQVYQFYNYDAGSVQGTLFQPHVAEAVFSQMLEQYSNIWIILNVDIASVGMSGGQIEQINGTDGVSYSAKMFVDASYTGDLMASAHVSYTIGREARSQYNEAHAGVGSAAPIAHSTVDPYVTPGNPSSGYIPHVAPSIAGALGSADNTVMAYTYRLCITNKGGNVIPFTAPAGYSPSEFELLARIAQSSNPPTVLQNYFVLTSLPNNTIDMNSALIMSTDEIGANVGYADGSPALRKQIEAEHKRYIQALLYFEMTDPRMPAALRNAMATLGYCKNEFTDNGGWPNQIYVREARRMIGSSVFTSNDISDSNRTSDPIGVGGYKIDDHPHQQAADKGNVSYEKDGDFAVSNYLISYKVLVPKSTEATNLFVPVCVSASHVAYASLRMESTYMIMGQAAGAAASIAIDKGVNVQAVDYPTLKAQLLADGVVLATP